MGCGKSRFSLLLMNLHSSPCLFCFSFCHRLMWLKFAVNVLKFWPLDFHYYCAILGGDFVKADRKSVV